MGYNNGFSVILVGSIYIAEGYNIEYSQSETIFFSRENNGDQLTLVFDCAGCGLKNMDMELIQYMITVFKDYYPWSLNYILVFEMPWVLNGKQF